MAGRIITVVGGSGFLGRYVVQRLAEADYTVRVLCRHPSAALFLKTSGHVGQIVCEYADLARPDSLKNKLNHSAAVINLAGILCEGGKQRFAAVHAQGAEKLAQLARESGVPGFIHISALGIERATASTYARTKLAGEQAVRKIYPDAVILRPSVMFGAEDNLFNQFARLSQYFPALPAIGGGVTKFQPVYVDDVAHAIMTALQKPECRGKTYELGGPTVYTLKQIMQYSAEMAGNKSCLIPVPFPLASLIGSAAQLLPNPMLTSDQVKLLKQDNVVGADALGFAALGIDPTPVEAVVPHYLSYRRAA